MQVNKPELVSLADFKQLLFDKIIPVRDLLDKNGKPLKDLLFFWRRKELIPYIDPGKWLKISFAQLIWIRILEDLREISFPVEKMRLVCDYFFKDAYEHDLPRKNIAYNISLLEKKEIAGTLLDEEENLLYDLRDFMKQTEFLEVLKFDINYLTNAIIRSLAEEQDVTILIFFNGLVAESDKFSQFASHATTEIDLSSPHIRLSLSYYLREFIQDDKFNTLFLPQVLNEDEMKVLQEMRRRNVKEIVIYNNQNGKPLRIESTKIGVISASESKKIKEILGLKNYERITLDTLDEKSLSFKMTRKKI